MGCHTWTYKKISALTQEEKNNIVNEAIKEAKNWWGFQDTFENIVKKVSKWPSKYTFDILNGKTPEQYTVDMIDEFTEKLNRTVNEGLPYIIETLKDDSSRICEVNGELYYKIGFNDPFRVYGYPSETFTNLESLLEWLKNYNNKIGFYDEIQQKFIDGYTQELENNIVEFFNKHGKDNLYIEFG